MALTVTVTPGVTVVDGTTPINAATLNAIANPSVAVTGTIGGSTSVSVDNVTIDQSGAGSTLQVKDLGITAGKIASNAVTNAKLADDAVDSAEIADGAVDAVHMAEIVREGTYQYATGTYSAGVYVITLTPAVAAYTDGMVVRFQADATNNNSGSGAVNININTVGEANLVWGGNMELAVGEIIAGDIVTAVYDGANFKVCSISRGRYVSAATALSGVLSFPLISLTHGMGALPRFVRGVCVCTSTDAGWAVSDEIGVEGVQFHNGTYDTPAFTVGASSTTVFLVPNTGIDDSDGSTDLVTLHKTTGARTAMDRSKWSVKVYAER